MKTILAGKRTLRSSAALLSALATVILGLPLFGSLYLKQKHAYETRLLEDAKVNVEKATSFIVGYFYSQGNWMNLEATQKLLNQAPNVLYSYIVGESKTIDLGIQGLNSFDLGKTSHDWEPEIPLDLTHTHVQRFVVTPQMKTSVSGPKIKNTEPLAIISSPIYCPSQGRACAQLRVVVSFQSFQDSLSRLMLAFLVVLTVFATSIAVIVFLVVRTFLKPVRILSGKIATIQDTQNITGVGMGFTEVAHPFSDRYEETRLLNEALIQSTRTYAEATKVKLDLLVAQRTNEMAQQVAHDIRSPLAALNVVTQNIEDLPEDTRVLVKSATKRIQDIANNLLKRHSPRKETQFDNPIFVQLIPTLMDQVIAEKRLEFRHRSKVEIDFNMDCGSYGIFARVSDIELKSVLSNLINNGVEAITDSGRVEVFLTSTESQLEIKIKDNGNGIPPDVLSKVGHRGETHGKKSGSGLGLFHAKTAAESWSGRLEIQSSVGNGTEVKIQLPIVSPPAWFVEQITLLPHSDIVVLDDEPSIHQVWHHRFESSPPKLHGVIVHDFFSATALEEWIEAHPERVQKARFLVDYELNGHTGLELIQQLGIVRQSILVTGRYDEEAIQLECDRLGLSLLPKAMAPFIPIVVECPPEISSATQ